MKKTKKIIALFLALCMICLSAVVAFADGSEEETKYIPLWMKPYTVIVYDASGNPTITKGGELTPEEISKRQDIAAVGLVDESAEMVVVPNTKVEYDLHGFMTNIYYLVPGTQSEYQLSNPIRTRVRSGIMDDGTTYTYPKSYYNYDTQQNEYCVLTRANGYITGTGRITFYVGAKGEAGTHILEEDDCATKQGYADVKGGTKVTATNTKNGKSHDYYKYDVGSMPKAILDIWSDDKVNPITKISTNGKIDNVYSGTIRLRVVSY